MKFDVFFSICQTDVNGVLPNERMMFENFFDQVKLADQLGFETAWVAETHLSCQVQKQNPGAVIPHFKGEIGLNTDILQLGHKIFAQTEQLSIGSAISNILCNGGPMAHAERVRMFLSLHGLSSNEKRLLNIGFASGRFPFSNIPYGVRPRSLVEEAAWSVVKGKLFQEATEVFLRFIRGDVFSSDEVNWRIMSREDFRTDEEWGKVQTAFKAENKVISAPDEIPIDSFWRFDKVGVIPFESPLELLKLTIGTHDPKTQILANKFMPTGVFNLSITPAKKIEETHKMMQDHYHRDGGPWQRWYMPRTTLVFIDAQKGSSEDQNRRAEEAGQKAVANYWTAMEGTIDQEKINGAVENALTGNPDRVAQLIRKNYNPQDRLMLWFDFNNHNNEQVKASMKAFAEQVIPQLSDFK